LAREIYLSLSRDCFENIREIDLKVFMTDQIAKNNELSQTISSDFYLN